MAYSPLSRAGRDMSTTCTSGLLLLAMVAVARADSFDDFNRGLAAVNHGDNDMAISLLSRALSRGDLASDLQPVALVDRGEAYLREHKYTEATADYDAALKLKPQYFAALLGRAHAFAASGNSAAAASDCLMVMNVLTNSSDTYAFCGREEWQAGMFGEAAKKFEASLEIDPRDQYSFLWFCLTLLRSDSASKSRLLKFAQSLDLDSWPSPIVDLYLGNGSLNGAQRAASEGDEQTKRNRACEIGFYGGEWQLLRGDAAAGLALLKQAADLCIETSIEFEPTRSELKRLTDGIPQ